MLSSSFSGELKTSELSVSALDSLLTSTLAPPSASGAGFPILHNFKILNYNSQDAVDKISDPSCILLYSTTAAGRYKPLCLRDSI